MNIGLFGGTFDPPQKGHKKVIDACVKELKLDILYVVPNDKPTYKIVGGTMQQRYLMLKMMLKENPNIRIAMIEEGDSLTHKTVRLLLERHKDDTDIIYLINGSDSFNSMPGWEGFDYLKQYCVHCVAQRVGFPLKDENSLDIIKLNTKMPEISSTECRMAIKQKDKKAMKKFLEKDVIEFIETKGLYV